MDIPRCQDAYKVPGTITYEVTLISDLAGQVSWTVHAPDGRRMTAKQWADKLGLFYAPFSKPPIGAQRCSFFMDLEHGI